MNQSSMFDLINAQGDGRLSEMIAEIADEFKIDYLRHTISTLALIEYAEEEISAAIAKSPEKEERIWNSFKLLQPTDALRVRNEKIFRAHCREIIERVINGEDTRPATDAELLTCLSDFSLENALSYTGTSVAYRLFSKVFPADVERVFPGYRFHEDWSGEVDDLIAQARRKFNQENRRIML